MNASATTPAAEELRNVVSRAEKLIASLENSGEDTVVKLRARATQVLNTARDRLQTMQETTRDAMTTAARATDDYVRENPWQTLAYGIVFGMFIGALLTRRA